MRILLSTIGSRGDVQPLVALATQLKVLGQEVRVCVPPDFRDWIESLGIPVTPIGPEVRKFSPASPSARSDRPTPDQMRRLVDDTVATQFETITAAAQGCDIIVGATALQIAAHSVAEKMGIPYVFAAYSPTVLPSLHHAPPLLPPVPGQTPIPAAADNRERWARNAERFNSTFGTALNTHRALAGMAAVQDVSRYMFTDRPWLAADATLGPWPDPSDGSVFQPGAWILPDERPLPCELETFLEAGDPPVYFGFGSDTAPRNFSQVMIQSARALGCRAIVSRGWADLALADNADNGSDCLAIGEVNLKVLFSRVAAVVHHGGAGTTTLASLAGATQVVIPQRYDQYYWAQRIDHLGIGNVIEHATVTTETLTSALRQVLHVDVSARAKSIAAAMRSDGAMIAAQRLIDGDVPNSV